MESEFSHKGLEQGMAVEPGLEKFLNDNPAWAGKARLGLLCNPASVDRGLTHASALIQKKYPQNLAALFSPQHGFFASRQDNMVESGHMKDEQTGLPVFSLYGETRVPTNEMLDGIDVLLVDLLDVGTRVYTFVYTVSYCMEQAARLGKKVVILDRPNPVGGLAVEGNILEPDWASFVGRYPIPMRHGMTMGELARMIAKSFGVDCDLEVVACPGWKRSMYWEETGLPWVWPSPNLPTVESAVVYPGQVIWEGTNVSEGRGTTRPFEVMGAPYMDPQAILGFGGLDRIPGAVLRPLAFEPTSNKWAGELCRGFQIHVTERKKWRPYETALLLLQAILKLHGEEFKWKQPPYEYEFEKLPMDLILGSRSLRRALEKGQELSELQKLWMPELESFNNLREDCLIYA